MTKKAGSIGVDIDTVDSVDHCTKAVMYVGRQIKKAFFFDKGVDIKGRMRLYHRQIFWADRVRSYVDCGSNDGA